MSIRAELIEAGVLRPRERYEAGAASQQRWRDEPCLRIDHVGRRAAEQTIEADRARWGQP